MACLQGKRRTGFQRQKICYSVSVYVMFFIIGWIRGLFGPSFIDLLLISDVTLKLGSWISTLNFIGYAVGCVAGGFLYEKVSLNAMYAAGLLLLGILTAAIPWCFIFVLMVAVYFFQGFASGVVDTVGNAEMMQLWRDNKKMYFFMEFSYSVGVFIAPIVVAPFLSDVATNSENSDTNITARNITFDPYLQNNSSISPVTANVTFPAFYTTSANVTFANVTNHTMTSRLFVPYSISAVLAVLVSLPFIIKYFMGSIDNNEDDLQTEASGDNMEMTQSSPQESKARILPTKLKVICLVVIGSLMFLSLSLGEGFISFIVVYCVDELEFSPADGALVSAVSSVCCIIAIVIAMFASRLSTLLFLGIHITGTLVGLLGLLFSSIEHTSIGVWISAAVVGYFRSMTFSLVFTWTNNYITPTTGKISSLYMVCTCTGSAVVPLLLGWLMEEHNNLWFCFLLIIFGACVLVLYIVGIVLTKRVTKVYGRTFDKIVIHDIDVTERLNKDG
ncbi:major facilitator superfamily domain-containing protein 4A-like [Pecten maximus]|uniref:major facilitator superfamily domain-containing protein 4A-like n=1 Tax=Pecten maximus TaxID=6579 RepID=UPI001458380A|nr:major facilitator superfamily domain-containing protein 4A-like [Pecten maximus]